MTNFPHLKDLIHGIDSQIEAVEDFVESSSFGSAPEPMAKYILVTIGSRSLAIAIDSLAEVGAVPKITFLPNLPDWILGIMNIRSEIVSMVDFTSFLKEEQLRVRGEKKLVVLRNGKMKVGIGVDSIVATVTKKMSEIQASSGSTESPLGKDLFLESFLVDGFSYSILDVQKFLTHPRLVDYSSERLG
ncbi:MAG: chemotaxis signal transduction protein [Desulforhopalus sp.]|jgi:chemotaxis signal transduction protein